MVIGMIGESCTGKTTLVNELKKHIDLVEYSGKDYLKLDKNPNNAKIAFKELLQNSNDQIIVYVITDKEHLKLLPEEAIKVVVTAELEVIKERFSKRMNNNLPKPVEMMLERKHGMFNDIKCDLTLSNGDIESNVNDLLVLIRN